MILERIRTEKEELIKQGKIKRDKKESVIFKGDDNSYYERVGDIISNIDDEIPFELPQNWEWSRLQTICYPITDGTHKTPTYSDSGYIFLSAKNITTGKINWNDIMYIPKSLHDELYSRVSPKMNDILLAKNGTTGVAAIVDRECELDCRNGCCFQWYRGTNRPFERPSRYCGANCHRSCFAHPHRLL